MTETVLGVIYAMVSDPDEGIAVRAKASEPGLPFISFSKTYY